MKLYRTYRDYNINWDPTERIYAPLTDIIGTCLLVPVVLLHLEHIKGPHLSTTYWNNTTTNFNIRVSRNIYEIN